MDDDSTDAAKPGFDAGPPLFDIGTVVASRYELRRLLGHGGSARVYAAFDRELKREVAIKILRGDRATDQWLRRFRREVVCARQANSPYLLRVFDLGQSGGLVYLTMELVEGGTAADLLQEDPPIDRILTIAQQVLEALDALHRTGVVHRDVKPSNVLVASDGSVKLGDFGLARFDEPDESMATADETVVGTWSYVSPEQARGYEATPSSDLYAFGVLMYEMLSGSRPFEAPMSIASVVARVFEKAPDVRAKRPEVPRWLARMVSRLLEKDPRDRYGSAAEVLRDLRRKRVRARLRWLPAVAAVVVIACVAGVLLFWQARQASRFDHLADAGSGTVRAYARDGRVLWSRSPALQSLMAMVRMPGGKRLIAAVPDVNVRGDFTLQFFDPQSGAVVRMARLPSAAAMFPQFSPDFGPSVLTAADVSGSGVDRVFVTYVHAHYWPSFTDEFDPRNDRGQILFVGSGHHRIAGFIDVNGDGRKEAIIFGPNNRMGWFNGVAAVPVTRQGANVLGDTAPSFGCSPDEDRTDATTSVLWYALIRRGFTNELLNVQADPVKHILTIPLNGGPPVRLTYDGFLVGSGSRPVAERQAARNRAYVAIREAQKLADERLFTDSVPFARNAVTEAAAAQDALLGEWGQRVLGKDLIDVGSFDEAEAIFRKLLSSSAPSDSCYDAAHEFHRRGQLDRAIRWYRAGLGPGSTVALGRLKYEFLEGEVLALGEQGRWGEAEDAIRTFRRGYPEEMTPDNELQSFVLWRSKGTLPARRIVDPSKPDLQRYWMLEMSYAAGDDPAALLQVADAELQRISGPDVLVQSVRAGLLERLGRHEEALRLARSTWQEARGMTEDPIVRTNLPLVKSRYEQIARAR